ncbi:MAG: alginate O-acetyltransferase AlgF [Alkalispirochaeta sp.]
MSKLSFRRAIAFALAGIALGGVPVFGQDGLYAPRVPDDAALVRVANLHGSDDSPRLDVGRERFAPRAAGDVGPYRAVPPGVYILGGAGGVDFTPEPGRFYTIIVDHNGELTVLQDEAHTDPARAQLVLYNFSDSPADLVAVPGDTVIFEEVSSGRSETIAVNAVSVELSVRSDGEEHARRKLDLERGESYALFVGPEDVVVAAAAVSSE